MDEARDLGNRYLLEAEIGRGPMASVFRAVDLEYDQPVAVKVFQPRFQADPRFAIRFRNHLKTIAALDHQNLVTILDYGYSQGDFYMVTEWVNGSTLSTFISERGVLSPSQAVWVSRQICAGVDAIHQHGLIHRDLKPENVLLGANGQVKVADAGLTSLLSESGLSRTNVMLNGVGYMAPEQARGEATGPESDIYSIGILLFEMLTDRLPFESSDTWSVVRMHAEDRPPSILEVDSSLPAELSQIVDRALEKDPASRFASAGEMDIALAKLPQAEPIRWPVLPNRTITERATGLRPLLMRFSELALRIRSGQARATMAEVLSSKPSLRHLLAGQFFISFLIAFVLLLLFSDRALTSQPASDRQFADQEALVDPANIKNLPDKSSELLALPIASVEPEDSIVESPTATPEALSTEEPGNVVLTTGGGGSGQGGGGKGKGKGQEKGNKGKGKGKGEGKGKGK